MGVRVKLNSMNEIDEPTLVLATRKGRKLGSIPAYDIVFKDCLNSYSEISFRVSKDNNGKKCLLWDELLDFKLLWCKEYDLWFEIYVEINESNDLVKNVIGKTVCEAELSQINLYNIEINTEEDIAREDYKKPTIFFDEEYPENSLLNRLMEKAPHYMIAHVDKTISKIQKTFSFDGKSIYDAFQEISEEIGCIFILGSNSTPTGTIARTISVYDLQSNCHSCGYRGEFTKVCPKCNSSSISHGYGDDTGIFVSSENLAENITYKTDTGSVKNCFKLEAGDDLMNATIRNCNPNGTDYIWHISDSVKSDMSDELVKKIDKYDELYEECQNDRHIYLNSTAVSHYNALVETYNSYRAESEEINKATTTVVGFPSLMTTYYDTIDLKLFLQSGLMPSFDMEVTTAAKQAALLTQSRLSPVAVINASSLSKTIVESAVLGMAKIYINTSYTVKVNDSDFDEDGKTWTGNFTVTNLYDDTDYATSGRITITINDDVQTYLEQKVSKAINSRETDKYNITGLFSLSYSDFCNEIKKYSLNCLSSFHDACQAVLDILTEQSSMSDASCSKCGFTGQYKKEYNRKCPECGHSLSGVYTDLYYPYWQKLKALQTEISVRENDIGNIEKLQNFIIAARNNIQSELNFEDFMGKSLWEEFCAYRREDKFSNSNYISDGLDNAELFARALEFIQAANLEIYKSSELQHSITSTLKNLLVMEEFQPLISNFEVGNWLRLMVDDEVYKLRLLEYEIDYGDLNNISVVFSDVVRIFNGYSDIESILRQASSMATSYDAIAHQASQGDKGNKRVSQWVEKGLALTNSFISDSDNQEVVLDSHGFTMKEYLPITDNYSDKQLKIINKGLYVTNDSWETSRAGIGNFIYYDPRDGITKEAYGVIADTLVGNFILGENVGIYNKNNSITLNEKGFYMEESHNSIVTSFNVNLDPLQPNKDFLYIGKQTSDGNTDVFRVDKSGHAYFCGDISGASGKFSGTLSIGKDKSNNPVFTVDKNGNVVMNGGITLGGEISWGDNDPTQPLKESINGIKQTMMLTLYSAGTTNDLGQRVPPTSRPTEYPAGEDNSNGIWHKSFDSSKDRYVSRSFDYGQSWCSPELITALTSIDATGIYTGTLIANQIESGRLSTYNWTNGENGTNNDGYINMFKQFVRFIDPRTIRDDNGGFTTAELDKMTIGFLKNSKDINVPLIVMGAGDDNGSGRAYIEKDQDAFSIYYDATADALGYITMVKNNTNVIGTVHSSSSGNSSIDSEYDSSSDVIAPPGSVIINGVAFPPQKDDKLMYHFQDKANYWDDKLEKLDDGTITDGQGKSFNISLDNLGDLVTVENGKFVFKKDVKLIWNADNSPVKAQYSVDGISDWHDKFDSSDYFARYSYDGGSTYTKEPIRIQGSDGVVDDSTVYNILQDTYNITHTEIDGTHIESPVIQGAQIYGGQISGAKYIASGSGFDNEESVYYVYNQNDECVGYLCYDYINDPSNPDEKKEQGEIVPDSADNNSRVFLATKEGTALKLYSGGNMSLQAGTEASGTIYMISDVMFNAGSTVNFDGVTVTGLTATFG